ncbi:SufD family Fe-S cluster assembly protein, partial [Porphyromonas gingivalis]|uniref:SufD family Fe-S cluster assembly protein n=1 Tax=Porphyromonas gingivalis TaxID=837 RepID=UPI0035291AA3
MPILYRRILDFRIGLGKNTRSRIVSKGISAGSSQNSYRGLVKISKNAVNARNHSQC